jgi:hypothetical protein
MSEPRHPRAVCQSWIACLMWLLGYPMAVLFVVLTVWLLYLLYFDRSWEEAMVSRHTRREGQTTNQEQIEKRRSQFHIEIPYSLDALEDPPVCITCHTAYPHREDTRTRAYLNAHGTHLACETCHHRPDAAEGIVYRWIDDSSDQVVASVTGSRGVYGAHVYPCRADGSGRLQRLGKRIGEPQWSNLAEQAEGLSLEQRRAICDPAHDELQGEPIGCSECHRSNGPLDFAMLGHGERMVQRLENLEVVEMLESATEFHFPDIRGTRSP